MSLSSKLTPMMNAVRTKYGLTDKLGFDDVTKIISADLENPKNVITSSFIWHPNQTHWITEENSRKFISDVNAKNSIGVYLGASDLLKNVGVAPGKRYNLSLLIRGTLSLSLLGNEHFPQACDIKLDPQKQKQISFNFLMEDNHSIIIYGYGSKGDWFTIAKAYLSELGGN